MSPAPDNLPTVNQTLPPEPPPLAAPKAKEPSAVIRPSNASVPETVKAREPPPEPPKLYGTNQFSGSVSARGGAGATYGGAGTVYYKTNTPGATVAQVLVDNGGARGTNTDRKSVV